MMMPLSADDVEARMGRMVAAMTKALRDIEFVDVMQSVFPEFTETVRRLEAGWDFTGPQAIGQGIAVSPDGQSIGLLFTDGKDVYQRVTMSSVMLAAYFLPQLMLALDLAAARSVSPGRTDA